MDQSLIRRLYCATLIYTTLPDPLHDLRLRHKTFEIVFPNLIVHRSKSHGSMSFGFASQMELDRFMDWIEGLRADWTGFTRFDIETPLFKWINCRPRFQTTEEILEALRDASVQAGRATGRAEETVNVPQIEIRNAFARQNETLSHRLDSPIRPSLPPIASSSSFPSALPTNRNSTAPFLSIRTLGSSPYPLRPDALAPAPSLLSAYPPPHDIPQSRPPFPSPQLRQPPQHGQRSDGYAPSSNRGIDPEVDRKSAGDYW